MDELSVRWLRVLSGVVLLLGSLWVLVSTWDALLANDLLYPLTLGLAVVAGGLLVFTGLRAKKPAEPGLANAAMRVAGVLTALAVTAVLLWLTPMPASSTAIDALESDDAVVVTQNRDVVEFDPQSPEQGSGLVVYPGALVDPRAYAVLARSVAEQGHPVVVLKCPFNIAFLCGDGAAPYVDTEATWAVGGHSLGGVAASDYAWDSNGGADGLVLWASYPANDLSDRDDLAVTSISGSEDGLTTPDDIQTSREKLPAGTVFVEVDGAVHAYFGDYGEQPGDGSPSVDRETAQDEIVSATVDLLTGLDSNDGPEGNDGPDSNE